MKEWQNVVLMCVAMLVAGGLVYVGKAPDSLIATVVGGVLGLAVQKTPKPADPGAP